MTPPTLTSKEMEATIIAKTKEGKAIVKKFTKFQQEQSKTFEVAERYGIANATKIPFSYLRKLIAEKRDLFIATMNNLTRDYNYKLPSSLKKKITLQDLIALRDKVKEEYLTEKITFWTELSDNFSDLITSMVDRNEFFSTELNRKIELSELGNYVKEILPKKEEYNQDGSRNTNNAYGILQISDSSILLNYEKGERVSKLIFIKSDHNKNEFEELTAYVEEHNTFYKDSLVILTDKGEVFNAETTLWEKYSYKGKTGVKLHQQGLGHQKAAAHKSQQYLIVEQSFQTKQTPVLTFAEKGVLKTKLRAGEIQMDNATQLETFGCLVVY
jgi:hypothetical protein